MASNPFFSGRIPQELYDAIELHREKSGESKTEVLIRALSAYVNLPVGDSIVGVAKDDRLEAIESRMTRMEEILASLQPSTLAQAPAQAVQGQMSIDDIQPSDNKLDNSIDIEILREETDIIDVIKLDNVSESQVEEWTTNQIAERLDVKRATLETWQREGKLPHTVKGYVITRLIGRRKVGTRSQNVWEVYKADPSLDGSANF